MSDDATTLDAKALSKAMSYKKARQVCLKAILETEGNEKIALAAIYRLKEEHDYIGDILNNLLEKLTRKTDI